MASKSTMTGINVLDSRNNSLSPASPKKSKAPQHKTHQRGIAKNASSSLSAINKQTANQTFHDALIEIISNSQL